MNFGVKFRLAALVSVVVLMGTLIALAVFDSDRQGRELRVRLGHVDSESDEIAAHFKDAMREVNNLRLQDEIGHDAAARTQFLQVTADLKQWIDGQAANLTTADEKDALARVKAAYDAYLQTAAQPESIASANTPAEALAAFSRVRAESQQLFDLGQALAKAHYKSRNQLLGDANQRLAAMRVTILSLLALLFVVGAALAVVGYWELIAPLRRKLVESQSLVERHEKLASLGLLAAGVAHEIRNPLTAIKASLFLQQKTLRPGSPEMAEAELVQKEIHRLERIVNEFLHFARPDEPELALVPAQLPLAEVHRLFARELAESGIRLDLAPPVAGQIRADLGQIQQVLINLVKNSAESIGHDGTITLRTRRDRLTLAQNETEVVILEVADTGQGISAEVGKRLFDPFFTTKEGGTGLGLAIAARIVEKHGGALQYQSQAHRGTTFGVILPSVPV